MRAVENGGREQVIVCRRSDLKAQAETGTVCKALGSDDPALIQGYIRLVS